MPAGTPTISISTPDGAGSQTQAPARPAAWHNQDSTNALKSGLSSARGGLSQVSRPGLAPRVPTPSGLASNMSNLQVSSSTPQGANNGNRVYNPSMAPTPSAMTTRGRPSVTPSHASARSNTRKLNNAFCTLSGYTCRDFRIGHIISIPFHTPNTNPNTLESDPNLGKTPHGYTYSKRRMVVVLYKHKEDMLCLPLYSFGDRGINAKPEYLQHEYVCLQNVGAPPPVAYGVNNPVTADSRRPLLESTTIHLTGQIKVGCNEDILFCGRLTKAGYMDMKRLYHGLLTGAAKEAY